jgi:hypothetical protein
MEGWDSIDRGVCRGWLTNDGDHPAHNARVHLWYSTPTGDTMLIVAPSSPTIKTYAQVAFFAPAQITRGEARFPGFSGTNWDESGFGDGDTPPSGGSITIAEHLWCLLNPDSARGAISSQTQLAYHIVLNVETSAGAVQVHPLQDPLGYIYLLSAGPPINQWGAVRSSSDFHAPVRDSAGIKLNPRVLSIHWENYAGVADSVAWPYLGRALASCP